MAYTKAVSEVINKAAAIESPKDRVLFLQQHDSVPLRRVLIMALDSKIKSLLPEGKIEYKENNEFPDLHGMFHTQSRLLYLFVEGGNDSLTPEKRKKLFVGMCESILPADAEMLMLAKDKKLPKTINKQIVNKAFRGLIT